MRSAASEEIVPFCAAVGVAAESRPVRLRLAALLTAEPGVSVRAGQSPSELLGSGAADDLLVIHLSPIRSDDVGVIGELKRAAPERPIIVVCESTDRRRAQRMVDGGVEGIVFADRLDAALGPTTTAVLAGQVAVPRDLRATLRGPSLSFREKQILGMVVLGFTNSEIASRLFVAESTVKSHLSAAFRKLGVQSRNEAASLILDPNGPLGPGILAITGTD